MAFKTEVFVEDASQYDRALAFAQLHGVPFADTVDVPGLFVIFDCSGVSLKLVEGRETLSVRADLCEGSNAHRRHYGGGKSQPIAKALGLNKAYKPEIFDATGGLGRDAFVMATLGAQVTLSERDPIIHLMLQDAIMRARSFASTHDDEELSDILNRMNLILSDSATYLSEKAEKVEVIYLDPMFPERKKSARVKKDMRIFHRLLGEEIDSDQLLSVALDCAEYRVVVKRPKVAPYLANVKPTFQLGGKSARFDIYTKKALPV